MPTYEYECKKCGLEFERFQRISEPPVKRCPTCKGAVRRKIGTGAGLLFKGSGFYITDYRSEGYQKAAKADSGASSSGSSSPSTTAAPAKEKPKAGKKAS
jgi:putative FmdB family regulatory protein